jgi:hypothetical protein
MPEPTTQNLAEQVVKKTLAADTRIYTMPEKFFNYLSRSSAGPLNADKKITGFKKRIIIILVIVFLFLGALGTSAYLFIKSIQQEPTENLLTENALLAENQPATNIAETANGAVEPEGASTCSDTNCLACTPDQCRILSNINKCELKNTTATDPLNNEVKIVEQCVPVVMPELPPVSEPIITPETNEPIVPAVSDADQDGLSTEEETIFQTSPDLADTDQDSYPDGLEIDHDYSPIQGASTRLKDSGLIKEHLDQANGFTVNYPTAWELSTVPDLGETRFTSTATGQFFFISVLANEQNAATIDEWYLLLNPEVSLAQLTHLQLHGHDALVVDAKNIYLLFANKVYLIGYNTGYNSPEYFAKTFANFYRSFSVFANPLE